jgi:alkane 1-monooxygenase
MSPAFRYCDLRFLTALLLPVLVMVNMFLQPRLAGWAALCIWAAVALVDAFWPGAQRSPPAGPPTAFLGWVLRRYAPLQMLMLGAGLLVAARSDWPTVWGLAFAAGFVSGAQGITFAHELGHGKSRIDRALAWALMASVNYSHFMVEHYRGHHVKAATRDDPASARRAESLWRFLPRTLAGSFTSAWRLEARRLERHGSGWWKSPLAWCSALNLLFVGILAGAGQHKMLAFWIAQSAFAIWLLETVNYIEHYGLQRRATAGGRPEPFGIEHAWNADHVVTNSLLVNLQRHSDHHVNPGRSYPELRPLPGPQLPTGYAGCLLLAAVPPLWFALMHRRLDAMAPAVPASA